MLQPKNQIVLTEHLENGLLRLHALALSVDGGVLAEGGRLPDLEAHAEVEEDHDRHGHDEEDEGAELEEERRRRLDRAERRLGDRL